MKKDRIKNILQKKGKKEKQVTGVHRHTQERIEKDFFFGFCDFINFFWVFVFIFAVRCLKITDFVTFPTFANRYITYPVLTSTNFYPLFKGRDTAISNFSTYHVFILEIKYYSNNAKRIYRTVPYIGYILT